MGKTPPSYDIDLCQAVEQVSSLELALEKLRIEATVLREYSQEQQMQASLDIDIPEPKTTRF